MRILAGLLALCLPMFAAAPAQAAAGIEVSAFVNVQGGVFELNARTIYPLDDNVRVTLADGATLNLELQAVVEKKRRYWLDATLVDVTLRRELTWNALTERYVLKDVARNELQSFIALDEALIAAGKVVDWPIVVEPQLDPDATYQIKVRAGIRRGSLPDSLRAVMFWSDSWNRLSRWHTWTLPR